MSNQIATYKIVNKLTNKKYFGSAANFDNCKQEHLNLLRKDNHSNRKLQQEFNKYGEENFQFVIISLREGTLPKVKPGNAKKYYCLISPSGRVHKGFGLMKFCEKYGICKRGITRLISGERQSCQGWRLW